MTNQELNNIIGNIFTCNFMDDNFRGDLEALNRIVLESIRNSKWSFYAIHSVENPYWIAWESMIDWFVAKLRTDHNISLGDNNIRYFVGPWFTSLFGDHHIALQPVVKHIESLRNSAEKEEESTMKNTINYSAPIAEEDIICSECGKVLIKAGEPLDLSEIEMIDGEYVCEDCRDEHFVQCRECEEWVRKEDARKYGREYICESCFEEYYTVCDRCGDIIHLDDAIWIENEEVYVCDDCLARHYTRCDRCGEYVRDTEVTRVYTDGDHCDWEYYCDNCLDNYAWCCDECGDWFSEDVSDNGCCRCDDCYNDCSDTGNANTWRAPHKRMPYGFKPTPIMLATDKEIEAEGSGWQYTKVFYGFELEIDRRNKDVDINDTCSDIVEHLPYCYCKTDCSLDLGGSYSGIEIVSHPATLAWYMEHRDNFEECFEMLVGDGWLSHNAGTCGLHIHISLEALEQKNPFAVNNMLFIFDRFWKQFVKFSRRTEDQLERWARRYSTAHGRYKEIKNMAKRDCNRYMAVNLQNRHTVELRMWRGTLNKQSFFATLQLVDTIVNKCIEIGDDYRQLQTLTWQELVTTDYDELNAYLELRELNKPEVEAQSKELPDDAPVVNDGRFHVGDRVRAIAPCDHDSSYIGDVGVVQNTEYDDSPLQVSVMFVGHGYWWCEASSLELIDDMDYAASLF